MTRGGARLDMRLCELEGYRSWRRKYDVTTKNVLMFVFNVPCSWRSGNARIRVFFHGQRGLCP